MYKILTTATALLLSMPCLADISVADLHHLEGTPLEAQEDSTLNWNTLDYLEDEAGIAWVWLQRGDQNAYLVYPRNNLPDTVTTPTVITFPDATALTTVRDRVNIAFLGSAEQQISFTRFGGEITLLGNDTRISYSPEEYRPSTSGNDYAIYDAHSMEVQFNTVEMELDGEALTNSGHASIEVSDSISSIHGTPRSDSLAGPNMASSWTIDGSASGNITIETQSTAFESIEGLIGGNGGDSFTIESDGAINSINGGSGLDTFTIKHNGSVADFLDGGSGTDEVILGGQQSFTLVSQDTPLPFTSIQTISGDNGNDTSIGETQTITAIISNSYQGSISWELNDITGSNLTSVDFASINEIDIGSTPMEWLITEPEPTTNKKKSKGGAANLFALLLLGTLPISVIARQRKRHLAVPQPCAIK